METIQVHGNGLFSKEEVIIEISKNKRGGGITFKLGNTEIEAIVDNVINTTRNTVLSNNGENICLVEHFLATCSLLNITGILVKTNQPELIFDDGSAIHWFKTFLESDFCTDRDRNLPFEKYELSEPIFLKEKEKMLVAIPYKGFKVSYYMDWDHPSIGKIWAAWTKEDSIKKLLRARSFARKEENDYFGLTERLLTLCDEGFNKKLLEPKEPAYHKILDIIGDLRLSGINPLEISMHVIGFKSGHALNVELARVLNRIMTTV